MDEGLTNTPERGGHGGSKSGHVPVLLKEAIDFLAIKRGGTYIDATVGLGGHSLEIAKRLGAPGHLIGLDKDPAALDEARVQVDFFRGGGSARGESAAWFFRGDRRAVPAGVSRRTAGGSRRKQPAVRHTIARLQFSGGRSARHADESASRAHRRTSGKSGRTRSHSPT